MTRDELVTYWQESAEDNYRSMLNMFNSGEYVWALFVGHLCIEKLLKACYVQSVDTTVPRIHDLYKLADRCGLEMTEEQKDALQYVNLFNIEARYEEYKREFHRKCTKNFAAKSIATIEELRSWLLKKTNS
ncbi:MAG: HEPN domain-containing protein [Desulfuromonadales bacterium]|nr:HEPN domain-containing protein [Desulfuromonadales bacterium]